MVTDRPISFSVSHSGEHALVAVVDDRAPLGIDVERVRPRARLEALAARALARDELAAWRARPANERLAAFLQLWTRKEAYLKATGTGITTSMRAVPVAPAGWTCVDLDVGPDARAALAIALPAATVALERWHPALSASAGTAS